jgi:nitroreductase
MEFSRSITEIIRQRFSCRAYLERAVERPVVEKLKGAAADFTVGPLGSKVRFDIVAASPGDQSALKGAGTYGLIKKPQAFIIGAVSPLAKGLEDFGYAMEHLVLHATDAGLGSCWIGGIFSKSNFAIKIKAAQGEIVPAVVSLGYIENLEKAKNRAMRVKINAINRNAWEGQFFSGKFGTPLTVEEAGRYTDPLEMVRIAPSASNKQPWRIVKIEGAWHFFLERTKGYGGGIIFKLFRLADIQRLDMGIAMCHFELTARQLGLAGEWKVEEPNLERPEQTEYVASWKSRKM